MWSEPSRIQRVWKSFQDWINQFLSLWLSSKKFCLFCQNKMKRQWLSKSSYFLARRDFLNALAWLKNWRICVFAFHVKMLQIQCQEFVSLCFGQPTTYLWSTYIASIWFEIQWKLLNVITDNVIKRFMWSNWQSQILLDTVIYIGLESVIIIFWLML